MEPNRVNLIEITGKALSGEWGCDDETGNGIPVLRTTNFTNEGVVDYSNVVTRTITKQNIEDKYLRYGDIIIEKSGGSDTQPVGRVIFFDGEENQYLFNNFTGLLRVKNKEYWFPKYVFYSLYYNYKIGGTRRFENKTTGLHNLKTDDYVSRFQVRKIELKEQNAICNQLDLAYRIIKKRRQQLEELDTLIKARFVEMFGDPILNSKHCQTEKMESRYMLKAGITTSADVIHDFKAGKYEVPCYGGNGIRGYVAEKSYEGIYPIIGRQGALCGNVQMAQGAFHATEHAVLVTLLKDDNPIWVYQMLKLMDLYRYHTGAAQPGLAVKTLNNVDVIVVNRDSQNQFADFVQATDKLKVVVQSQKEFKRLSIQHRVNVGKEKIVWKTISNTF